MENSDYINGLEKRNEELQTLIDKFFPKWTNSKDNEYELILNKVIVIARICIRPMDSGHGLELEYCCKYIKLFKNKYNTMDSPLNPHNWKNGLKSLSDAMKFVESQFPEFFNV